MAVVDKKGHKAEQKAWHDYFVEEKYEAGIELAGTEVKNPSADQSQGKGR